MHRRRTHRIVQHKKERGYQIMLSLLSLSAVAMVIHGVLLGSVIGLLYQAQKFAAHQRKCEQQIGEVKSFLHGHVRNLESRLTHLQTVVQANSDLKEVSEDSAERHNVCFNGGGKLD